MMNDLCKNDVNNSFSDLSSISGKSIEIKEKKVEIQKEIIVVNLEAPKRKQKKKRTKQDLDKTPLYLFGCIYCAN